MIRTKKSLQLWLVGFVAFGGKDPATGFKLTGKEGMFECIGKGGAASLTCQCLSDLKVSKSLGDGDDNLDK